jgi:predicted MFS family arabinose efflux permease
MAAATLLPIAFGIVAAFMIDDLGISRERFGLAVTVNLLAGAAFSLFAGRFTDKMGGRTSLVLVFVLASAGFVGSALSPWFLLLLVASALGGLAQGLGNPATNKLIAGAVPAGRRGVITGVKQSGVQVGVFVGGLLLPWGAEAFGWRPTLAVASAVILAGALFSALLPRPAAAPGPAAPLTPALTRSMRRLALYGGLVGFGGATGFFLPLYVEETLGRSVQTGGRAVAVMGVTAVAARIFWARVAERTHRFTPELAAIAGVSAVAALLLLAAEATGALLWVGAVLLGLSAQSWNSVGNLATMYEAGPQLAGHASGIVYVGFLGGLGIAPTIYGRTIDATGGYGLMWGLAIGAFLLALVVLAVWHPAKEAPTAAPAIGAR